MPVSIPLGDRNTVESGHQGGAADADNQLVKVLSVS
jgi:hypothetical protein